MTVKKQTKEQVKDITDKWNTTSAMRESLGDQIQLISEEKADPEVSEALIIEAVKVNKELRKRIKEMEE